MQIISIIKLKTTHIKPVIENDWNQIGSFVLKARTTNISIKMVRIVTPIYQINSNNLKLIIVNIFTTIG